jgi:hypothetical protein
MRNEILKLIIQSADNADVEIESFQTLSESYRGVVVVDCAAPMIIGSVKEFEGYEFIYGKLLEAKEFIDKSKQKTNERKI